MQPSKQMTFLIIEKFNFQLLTFSNPPLARDFLAVPLLQRLQLVVVATEDRVVLGAPGGGGGLPVEVQRAGGGLVGEGDDTPAGLHV